VELAELLFGLRIGQRVFDNENSCGCLRCDLVSSAAQTGVISLNA
jgi:hypothetical protein